MALDVFHLSHLQFLLKATYVFECLGSTRGQYCIS